jgi:hypothetical protein
MSEQEVVRQFNEWHLAAALGATPPQQLWTREVVRTDRSGAPPTSFRQLLDSDEAVKLLPEAAFQLADAGRFGISEEVYRKQYWSLRPDFSIEGRGLLVLLEAKGRATQAKSWKDPKEQAYYHFLAQCTVARKGFAYVIPRAAEPSCEACIEKHFMSDPTIRYLFWEDLLPLIAPALLEVAIDEQLRLGDGLRQLRRWQVAQRQQTASI